MLRATCWHPRSVCRGGLSALRTWIVFIVALLPLVCHGQQVPPTPELVGVTYRNCDEAQTKKLAWSVAYMKAAAHSRFFNTCLQKAVEGSYGPGTAIWGGGQFLHTHQESTHVGPYLPCRGETGQYREPEFVYQTSPFIFQNRLLGYEAALKLSQSHDALNLTCTNSTQFTASAPIDHGYFRLQHDTPYLFTNEVELGLRSLPNFRITRPRIMANQPDLAL
jgi:hypothetical protein